MTRDEILERFLDTLPFDPYPVQEEALFNWFESDEGVMVCAPTGMGKTLIAEAAIFEALHTRKRIYYTSPLIALTEQKYREIQDQAERWGFAREDVGFITGNRKENPDAPVRIVVAEILLNHLLSNDPAVGDFEHTTAVVMDEFHSFNDQERGIVWELSLVLLPAHVRVMLLSATVGNPVDFALWLHKQHKRSLKIVRSDERRVPLEFKWIGDQLLTELLPDMVCDDDRYNRTPALVFCFNRDECWEVAEKLKGLPLIGAEKKAEIERRLERREDQLQRGIGPKLRQMLLRGVGVHHAGVLPLHKELVEELFNAKLVPFVVCTETLAAGVNLPARSVVLKSLLKGKPRDKKLIPPSSAHQMFGRAGRPQFDTQGYVFAVAHDDDVKIAKWQKKYDQIDPNSKDPGLMRARKDLERKRPSRRKTEQYWTEGHLKQLIEAGPAKLCSNAMIPYRVLIFLLTKTGAIHDVRDFLAKRFNTDKLIEKFQQQLAYMLENLAALKYINLAEDGDHVSLNDSIYQLIHFRTIDPLYGDFLREQLNFAAFEEKVDVLDSLLELPRPVAKKITPLDREPGPLQTERLEPLLIQMGITIARPEVADEPRKPRRFRDPWEDDAEEEPPPTFPEMLKLVFDAKLAAPEPVIVQPKSLAAGAFDAKCDFYKLVGRCNLTKQEGIILRHLLRLAILASEFYALTEDPDYMRIAEQATTTCQQVDASYTNRFLAEAEAIRKMADVPGK